MRCWFLKYFEEIHTEFVVDIEHEIGNLSWQQKGNVSSVEFGFVGENLSILILFLTLKWILLLIVHIL